MTFAVLFVCTGNICRSPVAEKIFRARTASAADVVVSSAGTFGLIGREIDGPSAQALSELGIDPAGHSARRVDAGILRAADLVLTATAEHRDALLQLQPAMLRRTFTLREFGRLAANLDATTTPRGGDELRARVAEIASRRGLAPPPQPGSDDIGDPFGASLAVARTMVSAISEGVDAALNALGLASDDDQVEAAGKHRSS